MNYLLPALVISAGASVFFCTICCLLGLISNSSFFQSTILLSLIIFFLILTQYPLPNAQSLDCSNGGAPVITKPFTTFDHVVRLWRYSQNDSSIGISAWFGSKIIQAAIFNFVLCALIGAVYARNPGNNGHWIKALALGIFLSGGAELAQLTGLFGLYPCPWRQFEVDDLIFNIGGLMAGFAFVRFYVRMKTKGLNNSA
jgi:hypothetical protein